MIFDAVRLWVGFWFSHTSKPVPAVEPEVVEAEPEPVVELEAVATPKSSSRRTSRSAKTPEPAVEPEVVEAAPELVEEPEVVAIPKSASRRTSRSAKTPEMGDLKKVLSSLYALAFHR